MTDRELMQQALEALEYASDATKPEGLHGCECLICKAIPALIERLAQPEQELVTGNILKDAYNAMVEKKTRSQKLREAGFTRRPKGWEKEKDEQEPVAWELRTDRVLIEITNNPERARNWRASLNEVVPLYTAPRPWVGLTDDELEEMAEAYVTDFYFDTLKYGQSIQSKLKELNI